MHRPATVSATTTWTPSVPDTSAGTLSEPGAVHLWLLPLDEPAWPLDELAAELDDAEQARAARFHFERDARRWRAARGLLRRVLAPYAGAAPSELRFAADAAGKPALCGLAGAPAFNLSHSGGFALLGITHAARIGVDIEVMRPLPDRDAIAASHFAVAERQALAALPADLRGDGFFACWTRKEAYVKALGGGLSIPLADFEVSLDPREPAALVAALDGRAEAARWTLWSDRPADGVWAAAAIERNQGQIYISTHLLT